MHGLFFPALSVWNLLVAETLLSGGSWAILDQLKDVPLAAAGASEIFARFEMTGPPWSRAVGLLQFSGASLLVCMESWIAVGPAVAEQIRRSECAVNAELCLIATSS